MEGFAGGISLVCRESVLYCRMKASQIIPAVTQELIDLIPAYRDHPLVKQVVGDIKPYLKKLERAGKKKCDWER